MAIYRNSLTESLYIAPADVAPGVSNTISTRPVISSVTPFVIINEATVSVSGLNFIIDSGVGQFALRGVYVSAGNDVFVEPLSSIDLYSTNPALSADYPAFNGLSVEYVVTSSNSLTFKMPKVAQFNQNIDLIIANPVGYGKLTPISTTVPVGDLGELQNDLITVVNA